MYEEERSSDTMLHIIKITRVKFKRTKEKIDRLARDFTRVDVPEERLASRTDVEIARYSDGIVAAVPTAFQKEGVETDTRTLSQTVMEH